MAGSSLPFFLLFTLWWHILPYHSTCYLLYDGIFYLTILLNIYFMMAGFSLPFYLLFTFWWQVLAYHSSCYLLYDGRFPASLLLQRRRMSELRGSPAQSDAANTSKESGEYTEMKFLHMILTKDKDYTVVLCFMLFTVPSTGGFYRKLYSTQRF